MTLILCSGFFTASMANATTLSVCHGYDCYYRTKVTLTKRDQQVIKNLLRQGRNSPNAERAALGSAIAIFEERSTQTIGVRDNPRMKFGKARIKGQMDCIDESTNTDQFLRHLHSQGLLKYHTPARKA